MKKLLNINKYRFPPSAAGQRFYSGSSGPDRTFSGPGSSGMDRTFSGIQPTGTLHLGKEEALCLKIMNYENYQKGLRIGKKI